MKPIQFKKLCYRNGVPVRCDHKNEYHEENNAPRDPTKAQAIVVLGLNNRDEKGARKVKKDLEDLGYQVRVYHWYDTLPPADEVDVAVGHSAGAVAVSRKYSGNDNVTVIGLNSPVHLGSKNENTKFFDNGNDPTSWLADTLDLFSNLEVNIRAGKIGWSAHDKKYTWEHAKKDVMDKRQFVGKKTVRGFQL